MPKQPLLDLADIRKCYSKGGNEEIVVLDACNLQVYRGEIIALLGRTGSGKSTLLRIISSLIEPTSGTVAKPYNSDLKIAMVFQNFALFPWLTVLQNVELGLKAEGIPAAERREKALHTIDVVGMDGFESAYPKELSGGMCQRVGIARALVVEPDVLLMDEPFSALDVLTAENLRNDILDLWVDNKTNIQSIIMVTHNIEEAAIMADRILIFGANPGYIKADIPNVLKHPRDENEDELKAVVDEVYQVLAHHNSHQKKRQTKIDIHHRLPNVAVPELSGLLENLAGHEQDAEIDLSELADEVHLDVNNLFELTEVLELLAFAKLSQGKIMLTELGRLYATADVLDQKNMFSKQILKHIPLASYIAKELANEPTHRINKRELITVLENKLSPEAAEEVLTTIIDWGRFAEIFAYNANAEILSLEDPS